MRWLLPLLVVACSVAPRALDEPVLEGSVAPGGAIAAPDGAVAPDCAKGCSAPTPDETHPLSDEEALAHFAAYGEGAVDAADEPLETLLFHRKVSLALLDTFPDLLPSAHEAFLRRELARDRVEVAFRLVDDEGRIHGEAVRTAPLKEKQHVVLEGTGSLKHIEVSGKTKRVGLHHLWSRW